MELADIAKIAVAAAPYAIDKPYDYLIPPALQEIVRPGVRVTVPFGRGNRTTEGIVLSCTKAEKTTRLKAVIAALDSEPVLEEKGIALALWMRQRYFCTLYEAVKTILPVGLWYQVRETFRLAEGVTPEEALAAYPAGVVAVQAIVAAGGSAELSTLRTACGSEQPLRILCRKGILTSESVSLRRIQDKTRRMAELALDSEEALAWVETGRKSPVRQEAVRFLAASGKTAVSELTYYTGASMQVLRGLEKAGILTFSQAEELRVTQPASVEPGEPIVLNQEQAEAFSHILALTQTGKPEAVLLQGVTGSGKTQVYLRLVQEFIARGKTAIVLVPEIVLTPQMMHRFSSYFGDRVAMVHSGLRISERYDQWKRIRRGEVDVVLGTRSAIFTPLPRLGLIILDEEQESSYQSENPPRYHTREIAKFRCAQECGTLLLGSATPAVESAYAARKGSYRYERLEKRYNEHSLPRVILADLREEIRRGNAGLLSQPLIRELEENLRRGEQSILFLNRRGNSRMFLCGECGYVPQCPRCSVAMTYHSANGRMMCHYCGHSQRAEETCPVCGGRMKHVGIGTQRAEQELHTRFPETPILRMDADTATGEHEALLQKFETEKIPILLGTQMVAKGLDFENVTLVGVLSADLSLYVDHYRAAERTFSLLTQVVGRAGRGDQQGRAVIQTYTPENSVILAAAAQDYDAFYESELALRRLRRDPPFADLFTFTVSGGQEGAVLRAAAQVREELRQAFPRLADSQPEVLGPAPAPVVKVNNRYRYRIVLVGRNDRATREVASCVLKHFAQRRENRGLNLFVDCNAME